MCGNNNLCGYLNNNWWWIVILVLLFCNTGCGCGNNGGNWNGCYDNNNNCGCC